MGCKNGELLFREPEERQLGVKKLCKPLLMCIGNISIAWRLLGDESNLHIYKGLCCIEALFGEGLLAVHVDVLMECGCNCNRKINVAAFFLPLIKFMILPSGAKGLRSNNFPEFEL